MRPQDHSCRDKSHLGHRRSRRREAGFTIVELMMVVAIVAILAVIAMPSFRGYVYRSRITEATEMLSHAKLRQDSYRSEFGRYLVVHTGNFSPTANQGDAVPVACDHADLNGEFNDWPDTSACTTATDTPACNWWTLGVEPEGGEVRFSYTLTAGTSADMATISGAPWSWPTDRMDDWYIINACTNLDGEGDVFEMEVNSLNHNVYLSHQKGWD